MFKPGDIISHIDMCKAEGASLQRGMNFRLKGGHSVILMSVRKGAPYADRLEDQGQTLIYEGHDTPKNHTITNPKSIDQPRTNGSGRPTQNGLFEEAATLYKQNKQPPEIVRVYEKIQSGIWVFNGTFRLIDAWVERSGPRNVFKFKLSLMDEVKMALTDKVQILEHARMIPTDVKREVWKRDAGQCVECGAKDNLHYDHVIPFSKGGSSLVAKNIQLLCARHNLLKSDQIA